MVLVFLKDYLAQQACVGHTLVDRELRQRGDDHPLAACHRLGRVDESVFWTHHRDAVVFARLEAHENGHFLADFAVAGQVKSFGFYDPGLEQRQVLPCLARLRYPFLTFLPCIGHSLLFRFIHCLWRLLSRDFHTGGIEEIRPVVRRKMLLASAAEHLSLEPGYLSRQPPPQGLTGLRRGDSCDGWGDWLKKFSGRLFHL